MVGGVAKGNVLTAPLGGMLAYDVENRIVTTPDEQYGYAANNQRLWRTNASNGVTTVFFYDPSGQLMGEFTRGSGGWVRVKEEQRFYFAGRMVGKGQPFETYMAMTPDRLGSVGTGYFPYGEKSTPVTGDSFATYRRDGSGLDYAQNRYYQPSWGRFTSPDPYQASGGPGNPGSWNRYAYVEGDPVNATDPEGLQLRAVTTKKKVCFYVDGALDSCEYYDETTWVEDGTGGGPAGGGSGGSEADGRGGGGNSGTPASAGTNAARPEWLNSIASLFGYDENVPLPSCFGTFVEEFVKNMTPASPGPGIPDVIKQVWQDTYYAKAVEYAGSTPSKAIGTGALAYPLKSSVFRSFLAQAGKGGFVGVLFATVVAEGMAFWKEYESMQNGTCQ